jgi:DMSO/TMAO reductase YedYZ molybdopterin-dependent catalytic subunit
VSDRAGKLVPLSAQEWAKLPRSKVEVKGKDDVTARYEGVSLAEVLRVAGVSFDEHPRGRAAAYVVVEGSDGYRAVLALAEVDPKLTDRVVLLADRLDGKPLPDRAGPYRLVVPGDKLPVRWVRQVIRVGVRHPSDDDGPKRK